MKRQELTNLNLELEIKALVKKVEDLQTSVNLIKEQVGYKKYIKLDGRYGEYYQPEISLGEEVLALIHYLNLEIKKIKKEEKIIVLKIRPTLPKYASRSRMGVKNAKQKGGKK